jgi:uncharacterized FlaG/YvyC family protein
MYQLKENTTTLDLDFSKLAKQALTDAWEDGRANSYKDLEQSYVGIQARIDSINATRAQAERQSSADHSKIKQLEEAFNEAVNVINYNNKLMQALIVKMSQPIKIDGKEVLHSIEDSAGMSVNKLINKKTGEIILDAKQSTENNKNMVLTAQKEIVSRINSFEKWLFVALLGTVVAFIVPWTPVKLIVGVLGMTGGIIYDKFK